ncbi:MAG: HugZ family protein [Rhizobiaceae bacterium]|nr:HugZ family protein [Rhizobiaceae bacterium]
MAEEKKVIRDTDDDARILARKLIVEASFGAIAVQEPDTGVPLVSRVAIATDPEGRPIFLASELSIHSKCLAQNSKCSVLLGEPGKGDPLAHPRITLICNAVIIERKSEERDRLRGPYLKQHPKAKLYIDFGDFQFYRLEIERANLNGGFGKAYALTAEDFAVNP